MSRMRVRQLVMTALLTDDSRAALFQRIALAGVVLPHGLQKVFGWFGGWGVQGTIAWFESALGVPSPLSSLVIASDFLGAIALAFGLFVRLTALGIALTMLGAIALLHAPNGFFMNWSGANAGEGFEFHLLALALSLPLVVRGGGAWSLDRWLSKQLAADGPRGEHGVTQFEAKGATT
ncbi:MAG TPA: DoxX family protein [Polyangiaceae bacterium]|nr:DoxX family protein [Polyangiaceae bacterium]